MKNKSELIKIKKGECYTHEKFKISLIEASCKWTVDSDSALTIHLLLEKNGHSQNMYFDFTVGNKVEKVWEGLIVESSNGDEDFVELMLSLE
jgi:hypothetical protein